MAVTTPPPDFSFSGINFNPSFWVSPTSTLTQDVANTLYLRKTVTDSASALETFVGGIKTPSITALGPLTTLSSSAYRNEINYDAALGANDVYIGNGLGGIAFAAATPIAFYQGIDSSVVNPITPTTNLQIAPSLTSGELFLGVDNLGTNGRTAHIHIGDANNLPAGSGVHINNGTTNASNTNISNGASTSGNVNILSGATSTGTLTLGGSTTVTRLGVPLTPLYSTLPTIAQIGHVYAMTGPTFGAMGGSPATKTYTMNLPTNTTGCWAIFGTASLQCTANGTITSYKLYLNNGVTLANQQFLDKAFTTSNAIFTTNVSSVAYGPSNAITMTQELVFSSGAYSSVGTDFMFRIVRIA